MTYKLFYVHDTEENYAGYLVSFDALGRMESIMKMDHADVMECLSEKIRFAKTVVSYTEFLEVLAKGID